MKNRYLMTAVVMLITITSVSAQRMQRRANGSSMDTQQQFCSIDNLNEDQKENLKNERVKFHKEIQAERNQLGELIAKKRTIETTEPINQKNLDNILADITAVKTSMAKKQARHQQAIKSHLNDDQILAFNHFGNRQGMGMQQGQGLNRRMDCQGNGTPQMNGRKANRRGNGQDSVNGKGRSNGKGGNGQGNMQGRSGRGQGNSRNDSPLISDELREELKIARLELVKKENPLNNQLNELKAQYKTITYGKSVDLKKVDKNLEQQAAIKLELAKIKSKHQLEVRSQLTDEQKIWFDRQQMHKRRRGRMN